jgi:hypothetical protein
VDEICLPVTRKRGGKLAHALHKKLDDVLGVVFRDLQPERQMESAFGRRKYCVEPLPCWG